MIIIVNIDNYLSVRDDETWVRKLDNLFCIEVQGKDPAFLSVIDTSAFPVKDCSHDIPAENQFYLNIEELDMFITALICKEKRCESVLNIYHILLGLTMRTLRVFFQNSTDDCSFSARFRALHWFINAI